MQQILHIFKKDIRRHWLEILISLALLGLYARIMTRPTVDRMVAPEYIPWAEISAGTLTSLLIIFWIFLSIRLVQGETLVGDRQWWVTKPYEWWKLLAAKEVFLLAFIGAPLFLVQLYLFASRRLRDSFLLLRRPRHATRAWHASFSARGSPGELDERPRPGFHRPLDRLRFVLHRCLATLESSQ